jgi:hypothetical protein
MERRADMAEMNGRNVAYEIPVTEYQLNTPAYCSGAALATRHENTIHIVLFIDQPTVLGRFERVANLRVIMDVQGWTQTVQVVQRAIGDG